ncbi:MAG TPA: beta-ketoacyl synthase N-terminal-like domain-containing protein, partial [Longimicrobiales bacterium]
MTTSVDRAIAIVGVGAVLPGAPDARAFWRNLSEGRYSISETPAARWDSALYYDPDPDAPDKTYSKIGGWVRDWDWNPREWRLPIPPKVSQQMDLAQIWAIVASRETLADYGYPERAMDPGRTAVIFGNALGGDTHLLSALRILFPEIGEELRGAPSFVALPAEVRSAVMEELLAGVRGRIPDITEDTMPGELANIVAGRIAALFDFKGPNYVTDAACASAMAAMSAAVEGLAEGHYDAVLTGGIDANMSASTFVKFCKIGALSGTGTRPYAEGADGFVMGEGAACFLLKRLADAEEDGDRIYAVIRSLGGSSDGRGKGITAPNPIGQRLAVERAWERIGLAPAPGDLVEGHGTSTRVGDIVEVESLSAVFSSLGLPVGSVALGSVKSNIGHLKGAAGAAGLLKAALSLHEKMIPPSLNFLAPNPEIDFSTSPFVVNTELRPWAKPGNGNVVRRAGVSAFGFGGTNFHAVLEEHVPGRLRPSRAMVAGADLVRGSTDMGALPRVGTTTRAAAPVKAPLRGALCLGGADEAELARRLRDVAARAAEGHAPEPSAPLREDLDAPVRVAVDHGDTSELADLAEKAAAALEGGDAGRWKALRNKGVYLGRGRPGKVAFLFTGQGSQYVDMIRDLWETEPLVADVFAEADETMRPLLDGGTLTERVFLAGTGEDQAAAEESLKQTAVTQPAVLAVDTALARILGAYGIEPDMVMGHSLGEYAALVAAGALSFSDALTAVSARGRAMTHLSMEDNGLMAAVFGPVERVDEILAGVDGYVVVANLNSTKECVIGGATDAMGAATLALQDAGLRVTSLPVSHAFHTRIVQPAAEPLMEVLRGLDVRPPRIPVVANVDGEFYPMHPGVEEDIVRILGRQIGSPVQFVRGLRTLHGAGATIFVEAGPKRSLYGFAEDVLGDEEDVSSFFTNHPRTGGVTSVNRALCGLYARGLGRGRAPLAPEIGGALPGADGRPGFTPAVTRPANAAPPGEDRLLALGRMFADFMEKSLEVWAGSQLGPAPVRVGITGASLGLPGLARVFDESGVERILRGEQFIGPVPEALRVAQVERRITRLVKDNNGEARFETIADREDVVKLAGRGGELDLVEEYGYPADRVAALDRVTRLAIAAGLDALRDAGIPLIRRYKTTTTGSQLPVGWSLPEEMRDDTGVILGSAFPGYDTFARNLRSFHEDQARRGRLQELRSIREELGNGVGEALDRRVEALAAEVERHSFALDRRFLFQVLSMGHSQFAEFIGARGPNTAVNAACASGTQAISLARDWISTGQCGRVIVLTADDVTTDELFPWMGSGFLATGAAATDALVEDAALPFDRRRHGMIVGMGGAALVVEDLSVAASRGIVPIAELLGSVVANSAFHGTRLDTSHIADVMEDLVAGVEARWGLNRRDLARHMVFVSHETYTPARGGSAGAEVEALRHVFGSDADGIVVANTKGYTGHPMGVAIEDTLAVKILETGIVPPVANFAEVDPDLGRLNLSSGGRYDVRYALRLAAGFGSQVSVSLVRWTPPPDGARREPSDLGFHHRLADPGAWARWLMAVTGYESPELEVVRRTLRVRDDGPPRMPVSVRSRPAAVMEPTPGVASGPPVAAAVPERGVPERDVTEPAVAKPVATGPVVAEPVMPEPAVTKPVDPGPVRSLPVDPVRIRVLEIVADQTGYPVDMLDLDLDLEADLGIDTVKQAEMFAAI